MTMQSKTQGCGCGGKRGGCGCKAKTAAPAMPESALAPCTACETAAFVRPRFFAGQLLTEDDLGALIDYTLAKQRFHNTRLFGAGVVCGLDVACGPCDSSQVVVEAGYAIDGCGNDLVLGCARTLDLAPMIRELRARQRGGADCTDPCPPPASQTAPAPHRHYALYARYTERADQPVAAYPVGDDCEASGAPSCEATRILEGIAFELRCPAPAGAAETMAARLASCPGGLDPGGFADKALVYARYQRQLARALARRDDALDSEEIANLRDAGVDLESFIVERAPAQRLVAMAQYLTRVGGPFARVHGKLPGDVNAEQITHNLERAADGIALCDPAAIPLASERTLLVEAARLWKEANDPQRDTASLTTRLYLGGVVATPATTRAFADEIAELAAQLQAAAGCRDDIHSDCSLRELIDGLALRWNAGDDLASQLAKLPAQLGKIVDVLVRFVDDCRCAAISPPCAASDDPAVLLASIEVDRCNVVRICNTVRPYVLAPTTLRYWGSVELPDAAECDGAQGDGRGSRDGNHPTPGIKAKLERVALERSGTAQSLRAQLLGNGDAPALDPAALASELAELRQSHAALERRLAELELAARPVPPASIPPAGKPEVRP
jgi:hypothetical protein